MRENMGIYRGKRKDTGEWVEGYLAGYDLICPGEPQDVSHATGKYYGETPYIGFIEVDPAAVGQFTGLMDKNGKRIFGGDVVRGPHIGDELMTEPVEFSAFHGFTPFDCFREDLCEVIGNRFDNPELLEVTPDE